MKALAKLTTKTPIGALYLISDEEVLLAAGFSDFATLTKKLAEEDRMRIMRIAKATASRSNSEMQWLLDAVADYFDGDIDAFDGLRVRQPGSAFSQKAWRAMRKIPSGKIITYSQLAAKAGSPAAVRAAGTACGRNAIAPIIPCHRIIRSDGSLGNYGYGASKKSWLLRHEGAIE